MGRPEKIPAGPPHLQRLVRYLRDLRATESVTYEEMADRTNVSAATLKRVASGTTVPRWPRVMQFCTAASSGPVRVKIVHDAHQLWARARMEQRGTLHLKTPRPEYIADQADLSLALYTLYEYDGAPPLRYVQERAGGTVHLPLSTLARIVSRQTLPADSQQFSAFLRGCGVPEIQQSKWEVAFRKVTWKNDYAPPAWYTRELRQRSRELTVDYAPPAWYTQNA
ncbi:helix-turn-helix transcriptional regulator [Streptomyces sp. MS2A]|nr:helix-turn-helix transcriptional regulator [Streptomyces sp. MS2A]